jgi:hypothetical protein
MIVGIAMAFLIIPAEVFAQDSMMNRCADCGALGSASSLTAPVELLRKAAAKEGARLAMAVSTSSQQQPPPGHRRWIGRHPILGGALIGAAAGFAFGAMVLRIDNGSEQLNPMVGGLWMSSGGAFYGTLTGFAVWAIRR